MPVGLSGFDEAAGPEQSAETLVRRLILSRAQPFNVSRADACSANFHATRLRLHTSNTRRGPTRVSRSANITSIYHRSSCAALQCGYLTEARMKRDPDPVMGKTLRRLAVFYIACAMSQLLKRVSPAATRISGRISLRQIIEHERAIGIRGFVHLVPVDHQLDRLIPSLARHALRGDKLEGMAGRASIEDLIPPRAGRQGLDILEPRLKACGWSLCGRQRI